MFIYLPSSDLLQLSGQDDYKLLTEFHKWELFAEWQMTLLTQLCVNQVWSAISSSGDDLLWSRAIQKPDGSKQNTPWFWVQFNLQSTEKYFAHTVHTEASQYTLIARTKFNRVFFKKNCLYILSHLFSIMTKDMGAHSLLVLQS